MNTTDVLSNVKVASPCAASWDQMTGDDRARLCSLCQKHVYNLSALTTDEIMALIGDKEGKLCGRFYRRSDGSMLTADCPVGLRRTARRLRALSIAAVGLLYAGLIASILMGGRNDSTARRTPGRLSQLWNEAVWTVKGWLGIQPPIMIMGDICLLPPPPQPKTANPPVPPTRSPEHDTR
jgi:hypothetical protein